MLLKRLAGPYDGVPSRYWPLVTAFVLIGIVLHPLAVIWTRTSNWIEKHELLP